MSDGRWVQIFCHGVNAKGRTCGAHLGSLCLDTPHRTRKYCDAKHDGGVRRLEEYRVDSEGEVTMAVIPADVRLPYFETATITTKAG